MENRKYLRTAPPDKAALKAYAQIMKLAEAHALISQAYGGVAVIVIPSEQRKVKGMRQRILMAHELNETEEKER